MGYILIDTFSITGDCSNTGAGEILLSLTGSSGPFTISETTSTGLLPTSAVTFDYYVTNLPSNYYSLTIQDSAGDIIYSPFYISSGTSVSISTTGTTCGFDNGQILAATSNVYGSALFYLYDTLNNFIYSGSSATNQFLFDSLTGNTYYVVADDGGGCSGSSPSTLVTNSTPFTFGYYVVADSSCFNDGSGKIYLTGLTPASSYTINWLSDVNGQTGTTVTGLTSGLYSVEVINPIGCSATQVISVPDVPPVGIGAIYVTTSPTCFLDNGVVDVVITGGTAPYYYSGNTGQVGISFGTSFTFTGVPSAQFVVSVTDAGLCNAVGSTSVQTPNSFSSVNILTSPSTCSATNGVIQVVIDNGNPPLGTYTYTLSAGTDIYQTVVYGANQTWNGLPSGDYQITVEDTNGCVFTATTTLTNVESFSFTAETTGTTCGFNNGIIEVFTTTGGTLPYSYQLEGPITNPTIYNNFIGKFTNLQAGTYNLTVSDNSSPVCSQTQSVFVSPSNGVYFDLFPTQPVFGNDGSINVLITSGTPPFSFSWSGDVSGQTGVLLTGLTSGEYTCEITDKSGCTLSKSIILSGTKSVTNYSIHTICDQTFQSFDTITQRGIRQMFWEGYFDLTSGDTNCIINEADFIIQAQVGDEQKESVFYTSTGFNDYPSDLDWAEAIVDTLNTFLGISDVSIDLTQNRITIMGSCYDYEKNCQVELLNLLQDKQVIVDLKINYDISCVSCS